MDTPDIPIPLEGIETFIFCDETKFNIANGDVEDAIYYFGVAVERPKVPTIHADFVRLFDTHTIQAETFHSTTLFNHRRPRQKLMNDLTNIIINYRLRVFCFKYSRNIFFEPTKLLRYLNNDILDFSKEEFQALFYYLMILNMHLRDHAPHLLKKDIGMYFDRNVYGVQDTEAFRFPHEQFVLKQMTFCEKSKVSLLFLPDFFGYIFRNAKKSENKAASGDKSLETSKLVVNCYTSMLRIHEQRLFTFLDFDKYNLGQALNINLT